MSVGNLRITPTAEWFCFLIVSSCGCSFHPIIGMSIQSFTPRCPTGVQTTPQEALPWWRALTKLGGVWVGGHPEAQRHTRHLQGLYGIVEGGGGASNRCSLGADSRKQGQEGLGQRPRDSNSGPAFCVSVCSKSHSLKEINTRNEIK